MANTPISAIGKAMKLLSVRAYSEAELHTKLLKLGFPPAEVTNAVAECKRLHFVDDTMLAGDYISLLRQRNTGSRLIRQKLIRRGLGAELDGNELPEDNSSDEEREAALRALDYKWRLLAREKEIRKKREKCFRYLTGRGFPAGLIIELLNHRCREEQDFN